MSKFRISQKFSRYFFTGAEVANSSVASFWSTSWNVHGITETFSTRAPYHNVSEWFTFTLRPPWSLCFHVSIFVSGFYPPNWSTSLQYKTRAAYAVKELTVFFLLTRSNPGHAILMPMHI